MGRTHHPSSRRRRAPRAAGAASAAVAALVACCGLILVLLLVAALPAPADAVTLRGEHAAAKAKADALAASKPRRLGVEMGPDGTVRRMQEEDFDEMEEEEEVDEDEEAVDEDEEEVDDEDEEEEDEDDEDDEDDEEEDDEEKEKEYPELYVLDDVASEDGELRATLILDEISEYYEKDEDAPGGGQKYYKIMVHVYNSGFEPVCGVQLSLSETAEVEQAWTAEQVDDTNVFEVLWAENGISPDNPRSMSRFVGFVTKGDVVPEIKIDSISPCNEEDEEGDKEEDDEEGEEEEDEDAADGEEEEEEEEAEDATDAEEQGEGADGAAAALFRFMRAGGDKALKKVWGRDQGYAEDVMFEVDDATLLLQLEVDEAHSSTADFGLVKDKDNKYAHDVLLTAHITNTADHPVCGVGLWIHNLHKASSFFSLLPVMDGTGQRTDVAMLPTLNSTLPAKATHFFSVIVEDMSAKGFPNVAVVTASSECSDASATDYKLAKNVAAAAPKEEQQQPPPEQPQQQQ